MKMSQLTIKKELDIRLKSDLIEVANGWEYRFYWDGKEFYSFHASNPLNARMRLYDQGHFQKLKAWVQTALQNELSIQN